MVSQSTRTHPDAPAPPNADTTAWRVPHQPNTRREAFVVPFIPGTVPGWSDACFSAVEWPRAGGSNATPPRAEGGQGWCVARSAATDGDGWVYGTAFDHLREDRPGGRASKRANDRVRSRLWLRGPSDEVRVRVAWCGVGTRVCESVQWH